MIRYMGGGAAVPLTRSKSELANTLTRPRKTGVCKLKGPTKALLCQAGVLRIMASVPLFEGSTMMIPFEGFIVFNVW